MSLFHYGTNDGISNSEKLINFLAAVLFSKAYIYIVSLKRRDDDYTCETQSTCRVLV